MSGYTTRAMQRLGRGISLAAAGTIFISVCGMSAIAETVYYNEDFSGFNVGVVVSPNTLKNESYDGYYFECTTSADSGISITRSNDEHGNALEMFARKTNGICPTITFTRSEATESFCVAMDVKVIESASKLLLYTKDYDQITLNFSDYNMSANTWYTLTLSSDDTNDTYTLCVCDDSGDVVFSNTYDGSFNSLSTVTASSKTKLDVYIDNFIMKSGDSETQPTGIPSVTPTAAATSVPILTPAPTLMQTQTPTQAPTVTPTHLPTVKPTLTPTPTTSPEATGDVDDILAHVIPSGKNLIYSETCCLCTATGDFALPTETDGSKLAWESDIVEIDENGNGTVEKFGKTGTLTVTAEYGGQTSTKTFDLRTKKSVEATESMGCVAYALQGAEGRLILGMYLENNETVAYAMADEVECSGGKTLYTTNYAGNDTTLAESVISGSAFITAEIAGKNVPIRLCNITTNDDGNISKVEIAHDSSVNPTGLAVDISDLYGCAATENVVNGYYIANGISGFKVPAYVADVIGDTEQYYSSFEVNAEDYARYDGCDRHCIVGNVDGHSPKLLIEFEMRSPFEVPELDEYDVTANNYRMAVTSVTETTDEYGYQCYLIEGQRCGETVKIKTAKNAAVYSFEGIEDGHLVGDRQWTAADEQTLDGIIEAGDVIAYEYTAAADLIIKEIDAEDLAAKAAGISNGQFIGCAAADASESESICIGAIASTDNDVTGTYFTSADASGNVISKWYASPSKVMDLVNITVNNSGVVTKLETGVIYPDELSAFDWDTKSGDWAFYKCYGGAYEEVIVYRINDTQYAPSQTTRPTSEEAMAYEIAAPRLKTENGTLLSKIPKDADFILSADVSRTDGQSNASVIIAAYDEAGVLLHVAKRDMFFVKNHKYTCDFPVSAAIGDIAEMKVFVMDSLSGITPLADYKLLNAAN